MLADLSPQAQGLALRQPLWFHLADVGAFSCDSNSVARARFLGGGGVFLGGPRRRVGLSRGAEFFRAGTGGHGAQRAAAESPGGWPGLCFLLPRETFLVSPAVAVPDYLDPSRVLGWLD